MTKHKIAPAPNGNAVIKEKTVSDVEKNAVIKEPATKETRQVQDLTNGNGTVIQPSLEDLAPSELGLDDPTTFSDPLADVLVTQDEDHSTAQNSEDNLQVLSRKGSLAGSRPTSAPRNLVEARRRSLAVITSHLPLTEPAEWRPSIQRTFTIDQLLGLEELNKQLPNHRLRVFVGTWNINGHNLFDDFRDFLFPNLSEDLCDLYAIGIQEGLPEFRPLDIALQKAIGLSHVLYSSESVGTIHVSIFIRRDLIWFCTTPVISKVHLRLINSKNSKGFVACAFSLFGSSFMFITSHLTAGEKEEKMEDRIDQLNRIYREVRIPAANSELIKTPNRFDAVDYVFWFGDFNFRLQETRENVENTITEMSTNGEEHQQCSEDGGDSGFEKLLMWDQLRRHKTRCIIHDFNEHPITFLPTYKFDLNSDHYDRSSKQRTPSYTDRILFRSNGRGNPIVCRVYQSVGKIRSSDHRPVYGVFDLKVRPVVRSSDSIKICPGDFNRDVYNAAVGLMKAEQTKKRTVIDSKQYHSQVCTIL